MNKCERPVNASRCLEGIAGEQLKRPRTTGASTEGVRQQKRILKEGQKKQGLG